MTLYHGSNKDFSAVDFSKSKNKRDFGKGFYLTTIKEQALDWAKKQFDRFDGDDIIVYEYELLNIDGLLIKKFEALSKEWIEFVMNNRTKGGLQHGFDVVQGSVANDDTTETIAFYVSGIYSVEEALNRLRYMKPNDQVSVHTEKALENLILTGKEKYAK
ncbi:MAG: DUF3990 domain-containing protein [Termitinemataceae bacterium]|nr:MAG: DUF3990 domain-containing protein [Termitinemataceae bacterium]